MYELHDVIIHKPIKLSDAIEIAKTIIHKEKYFRETDKSYRFRNIAKTKFKPESFRTKIINKKVSLIFGELK
jgi:ABC-type antimicrobial peptide transport system ATPase subunit